MKKLKKLAAVKSARRRQVRSAKIEMLDDRLVLSASPLVAANEAFAVPQDTPLSITAPGLLADATAPAGVALSASLFSGPAHGSLNLAPNGSFTYAPDAGFSGIDSFTYRVADGAARSGLGAVTLDVGAHPAPALDLTASANGQVSPAFAATFTQGGGPVALAGPGASLADASSPELTMLTATITNLQNGPSESLSADTAGTAINASYDSGSGVLTMYGADSAANYLQVLKSVSYNNTSQNPDTTPRTITFVANDGAHASNMATTSLSVLAATPPTAADDTYAISENNTLNVPASGGVLANDTDPVSTPLTASLVAGPAHGTLTLNPDGSFNYAPAANFSGTDSFTYKANDGAADSNVATVNLHVVPVNQVPHSQNDSYSVNAGSTLTVTPTTGVLANDSDVDGDPLTAALVTAPQHGTATLNADGSFNYTPAAGFTGTDGFSYKANDGKADGNVAAVTINVNPVAPPPTAMNDRYNVAENSSLTTSPAAGVLRNDTDTTGDPLSASLVDGPQHGTVTLNADGSFKYTPAANFSGTDGFTYKANDGASGSNVAAVTMTVDPVDVPPVSANDSYSTTADTPLAVNAASGVLANDVDANHHALTASVVAGPQHGSLTLNADGSFNYTPAAGYTGADQFTYQAFDGESDGNVATAAITVAAKVNQPPVAANDAYSLSENHSLHVAATGGVLANDTDAENDPLTAKLVTGPAHGTLSLNADGSFDYTPAAGYAGADSFTYRANDGTSDSNLATASLTVNAAINQRPAAANDVYTTAQGKALDVSGPGVLANDADPDGDPLTASLFKGPQHGTLALNANGSFNYAPAAGFSGDDSFSYQASDGQLSSALAAVTIHVTPASTAAIQPAATGGSLAVNPPAVDSGEDDGEIESDMDTSAAPSALPAVAAPSHVDAMSVVMNGSGAQASLSSLSSYPGDSSSSQMSLSMRSTAGAQAVDAVFSRYA